LPEQFIVIKQVALQKHTFFKQTYLWNVCENPKKLESLCKNVVKEYKVTTWQKQYEGVLVKLVNQIMAWNALSIT